MSYWPIIFLLMLEYGFSIIMFSFMLTALFSKAKTAGNAGGFALFLITTLYYLQVKIGCVFV